MSFGFSRIYIKKRPHFGHVFYYSDNYLCGASHWMYYQSNWMQNILSEPLRFQSDFISAM